MRPLLLALTLTAAAAQPLLAQSKASEDSLSKCAQTEAWFNLAVDNRKLGETKAGLRRQLRPDMGWQAADQLVDFVYALPEEMLTHEVGAMARQQCESMPAD